MRLSLSFCVFLIFKTFIHFYNYFCYIFFYPFHKLMQILRCTIHMFLIYSQQILKRKSICNQWKRISSRDVVDKRRICICNTRNTTHNTKAMPINSGPDAFFLQVTEPNPSSYWCVADVLWRKLLNRPIFKETENSFLYREFILYRSVVNLIKSQIR